MTAAATDLIALPAKEYALAVFTTENGTAPYLEQIRVEAESFVPDVSTRKGRDAIASLAYKIARSKTALDDVGKELAAEYKEIPKKIDAERKRMRELLDALRDKVRAPLDAWEAAEKNRIAGLEGGIAGLRGYGEGLDGLSAEELSLRIQAAEAVAIGQDWQEFEAEAARTKDKTLANLRAALQAREKYEAEQAELARLRAEAAERERLDREKRIAEEAAERARQEEADRAERERLAAERREAELKLQAERANREKLEAQQRAERAERLAAEQAEQAAAAERQRIAEEQAAKEAEAKRREADREHKSSVLRAAKEAFMRAGITEDQAREVVTMIVRGQAPNVTITY